ncbi:MAG: ATP-binding protein [Limisphaerales bacterium]
MAQEYLSKVVSELVQNAFKFSQPGSLVRVTLREIFNGVAISVHDSGRGFSPEQIARIGAYMQFDRKMQEQQGLGLGLTLVKRLTELHGGTLLIEGEKNIGATVTAKLLNTKST